VRVFVAGATGAIGRVLVPRLLAAGHDVSAMTRTPARAEAMRASGAEPVLADAFDAAAVREAVAAAGADVVIDQLTDLPQDSGPAAMKRAAPGNNRVRREGSANVLAAAVAAGARRYVVQSIAFVARPGDGLADEDVPLDTDGALAPAAGAVAELERRTLAAAADIEPVVLRYGFFYGPGTWYARDGSTAEQVRRRRLPVIGNGRGRYSFVHVEDAAEATVAAIESADPGDVLHVADDQPVEQRVWLPAYARWLGAPRPRRAPLLLVRLVAGEAGVAYGTRLRGVSNERAKRKLGFRPRPLEFLDSSR